MATSICFRCRTTYQTRKVGDALIFGVKMLDGIKVDRHPGLYLSDVLATSYHCVVDTGVKKGDIVGIWGAGEQTQQWSYASSLSDFRNQVQSVKCVPNILSCKVHLG